MYKWKMKWYNSYLSKVALANDNLVIVVIRGKKAGPHACDKRKKIQESALFLFWKYWSTDGGLLFGFSDEAERSK